MLAVTHTSSGVPSDWAATSTQPGVALLPGSCGPVVDEMLRSLTATRTSGDLATGAGLAFCEAAGARLVRRSGNDRH